jgi:hypothetical protein
MLTDMQLRALKPKGKIYKVALTSRGSTSLLRGQGWSVSV